MSLPTDQRFEKQHRYVIAHTLNLTSNIHSLPQPYFIILPIFYITHQQSQPKCKNTFCFSNVISGKKEKNKLGEIDVLFCYY